MIPTTLGSLAIALAFVAPGLLYEPGMERSLGYWRTNLTANPAALWRPPRATTTAGSNDY